MTTQMIFKFFSITTLAILVVSTSAIAQEKKMKLRFLLFPEQNKPEAIELLIGEKETIKIEAPSHELSGSYLVPPLSSIVVGKTLVNDEGKSEFQTYGQAKSVPATEQIILLLRKGRQSSDGFIVLPIAADLKDFGGASFLFINISKLRIGGLIGDKELDIKPGERKTLSPKPNFEAGICQVTLGYLKNDKFKKFFDTRWPANKNVRSLVIFYQNPQTGRIGMAPITDIIRSGGGTSE
jgi:hypothetical protein